MPHLVIRSFDKPDETRPFTGSGHADVIRLGEGEIARSVFEPGWRWSTHVQPIVKTASCEVAHCAYIVSGRMHVRTDSGEEGDVGPGELFIVDPGHEAWVVGDEPCVMLDFLFFDHYAKARDATEFASLESDLER